VADYGADHTIAVFTDSGVSTTVNTVWDATPAFLGIGAGSTERVGLRYTTLPTTAVGSRGGVDLTQTANLYRTVTLAGTLATTAAGTLTIYIVDETSPAAFSNARVPGGGVLTETLVCTEVFTDNPVTFSATLDMSVIQGALGGVENPYHLLGHDGSMSFTIGWTSTAGIAVLAADGPTLTLVGTSWHSGIAGITPIGGRGHVDERTGQLTTEDDLIRDGYSGALVLPENWDPPDEDPIFDPVPRRFDKEL
jgi:hypothetical protein